MHELTLCRNIIHIVENQADQNQIKTIWVEVGGLAGIDNHALTFSFPIASRGTIAEGAVLEIIDVPAKAWCENCKTHVTIDKQFSPCQQCGSYKLKVIEGEALTVKKMEMI